MRVGTRATAHMWRTEQILLALITLSFYNSGHQAWQQVPLLHPQNHLHHNLFHINNKNKQTNKQKGGRGGTGHRRQRLRAG